MMPNLVVSKYGSNAATYKKQVVGTGTIEDIRCNVTPAGNYVLVTVRLGKHTLDFTESIPTIPVPYTVRVRINQVRLFNSGGIGIIDVSPSQTVETVAPKYKESIIWEFSPHKELFVSNEVHVNYDFEVFDGVVPKSVININGTARSVKEVYVNINGVTREITSMYVNINGQTKEVL